MLTADEAAKLPLDTVFERSFSCAEEILKTSQVSQQQLCEVIYKQAAKQGTEASIRKAFEIARKEQCKKPSETKHVFLWLEKIVLTLNQDMPPSKNYASAVTVTTTTTASAAAGAGQNKGVIQQSSYFFPSEESFKQLENFLRSAQRTLDICVFNITDNDIAKCVIDAKKRGVKIRVITDDANSVSRGSDIEYLGNYDIECRLDNSPSHMHNKFAIIDGCKLLNGSYNWTKGARRENRENIVLSNDAALAKEFQTEFDKLWKLFEGNYEFDPSNQPVYHK